MWSVRNLLVGWVGGVVCDLVFGLHLFVCLMVVVLGLCATVHTGRGTAPIYYHWIYLSV